VVALNFQPQFADDVEHGSKRQTIRRTARCKPGDARRDDIEDFDNDFARRDGFQGYMEMADWFRARYGWRWIGRYDDDPAATLDDMPPPTSPEQPQQECRP
jgi:hypothetical protein